MTTLIAVMALAASVVCGEYDRAVVAANGETFCVGRYAGPTQSPGSGDAASSDSSAAASSSSDSGSCGNGR